MNVDNPYETNLERFIKLNNRRICPKFYLTYFENATINDILVGGIRLYLKKSVDMYVIFTVLLQNRM